MIHKTFCVSESVILSVKAVSDGISDFDAEACGRYKHNIEHFLLFQPDRSREAFLIDGKFVHDGVVYLLLQGKRAILQRNKYSLVF